MIFGTLVGCSTSQTFDTRLLRSSVLVGCHLDISIDGYDVGGWTIDGGEELSIERPVYDARKFTFYRVKTAPKEAGIESGRSENGVVKCVFTPEAFLNIPVIISDLPQPLEMNMPPFATVADLKRDLQRQLSKSNDPDQVLVMDEKVLLNSARLRLVKVHAYERFSLIGCKRLLSVTRFEETVLFARSR